MIRRIVTNICLIVFGLIITLIGCEIFARLALPLPQTVELLPGRLDTADKASSDLYERTDDLFHLRPSVEVMIRNHVQSHRDIYIRTNSLGFRGPEPGPKSKPRVLFLGDSITIADSVAEEETFVYLTAQKLAREGLDVETINGGQGATGLSNHLALLRKYGAKISPDLIVLDFYLNDFQNSPVKRFHLPGILNKSWVLSYAADALSLMWFSIQGENTGPNSVSISTIKEWQSSIDRDFVSGLEHPAPDADRFKDYIKKVAFDIGGAWSPEAWKLMAESLREIKGEADAAGAKLIVVAFPAEKQVSSHSLFDYPQRMLKSVAASLGVPVLDLLPPLRDAISGSGAAGIYLDQCHFTPYGHQLVAPLIADFINPTLHEMQ